jgi:hypothetical protein
MGHIKHSDFASDDQSYASCKLDRAAVIANAALNEELTSKTHTERTELLEGANMSTAKTIANATPWTTEHAESIQVKVPTQAPKRGGRLALKGLVIAFVLFFGAFAASDNHLLVRYLLAQAAFAVGALYILSSLHKWRRNGDVVRGSAIGWTFATILLLSAVGILSSGVENMRTPPPKEQVAADHPSEPVYDPAAIIAEAKADLADKNYTSTLQAIRQLKGDDLRRPVVQTLFMKSSDALLKETAAAARNERIKYADEYERQMLLAGEDMTIRATGKDAQTLTVTYVLTNRPFVYVLMNDHELNAKWVEMGFTNIRLSDGYDYSWSFKPST